MYFATAAPLLRTRTKFWQRANEMGSADGKLLSSLAATWLADPRGRALLVSWTVTVAGVTIRAVLQRRKKRTKKPDAVGAPKEEKKPATADGPPDAKSKKAPSPIRALLKRAIPAWGTEPIAWGCALSVGIAVRLVVQIKVSSEIGAMGSLLAQRQWETLFQRQLGYALYGLPAALLAAFQKYASSNLGLALRKKLMGRVHEGIGRTSSLPAVYKTAAPGYATADADKASAGGGDKKDKDSPVQLATGDIKAFATEVGHSLWSPSSSRTSPPHLYPSLTLASHTFAGGHSL